MSSRDLKDYEKELLTYTAIAEDAIVIIVNSDNPLTSLTTSEIRNLFDGTMTQWSDLK